MSAINKKFFENFTSIPLRDLPLPNHYDAGAVIHLELNHTGTRMAYSRTDGSVRVWTMVMEGGRDPVVMESPHIKPVELLSFHPREEFMFATVARDEYIRIWRTNGSLQREIRVKIPSKQVYSQLRGGSERKPANEVVLQHVSYSSDGTVLIVADREGWIHAYDALYSPIFSVDVEEYVNSIMWFHFEHKYFACGLQDGTIPLFELHQSSTNNNGFDVRKIATLRGHRSSITSLVMDPRGKYFVAGSNEGVVLIWNTESMLVTRVISDVDEAVSDLDISRDGTYVAVTFDRSANGKIYDTALGEEVFEIPNSLSGPQVTPQIAWFPQKTTFVYIADKGRNVVMMKRPEDGAKKRSDDRDRDRDRDNGNGNKNNNGNNSHNNSNRKRRVQTHHRY